MAVDYGFYQSINGDRVYSDSHFAGFFNALLSSGVILSDASALQVSAGSNMTLNISKGRALLEGRWLSVVDGETVTLPNANGAYPRYDRVVVRSDLAERNASIVVISGVPASAPVVPDIVRDGTYFDISLCTVLVGVGVTKITDTVITDTRYDSDVCGFVTGFFQQIDSSGLFKQFNSWWNDFVVSLGDDEHITINAADFEARTAAQMAKQSIPVSLMLNLT